MKIGMVGLGKMGANMTRRLIEKGHEVVGFDLGDVARAAVAAYGADTASSLEELAAKLSAPRVAWVMVPAGKPTEDTVRSLGEFFEAGDLVIDGGNSNYKEAAPYAAGLAERGVHFVDAGTSGGIWGLKNGYCIMVGGSPEAVAIAEPIFLALAPEGGYAHVGPVGAGHFVKMVHNGIEYGLMEAYAEGFEIMSKADEFQLDLHEIASIWRYGSVVRSWLLDLAELALRPEAGFDDIEPFVVDSGEGRWTIDAALERDVAVPVIAASLFRRFESREKNSYGLRLLAALRNQFGGHAVVRAVREGVLVTAQGAQAKAPPLALVMFGASGDLTARKLLPALASLAGNGSLADGFVLVGVARTKWSDDEFRDHCLEAVPDAKPAWTELVKSFRYVSGNYDHDPTFKKVTEILAELDEAKGGGGTAGNRIFYLATIPSLFGEVARGLGRHGLNRPGPGGKFARLVIEKPFGRNLETAMALDETLHECFDEPQIYRIDHYMGKETVQNVLALRFANSIFEPVWNRRYVGHVHVTVAESIGVEHRGSFYETAGALRDIVQNHVMQVLALTLMEPAATMDPTSIRDEKVKLLRSIMAPRIDEVGSGVVRGQYTAGTIDGKSAPGYREEEGVDPQSMIETFVAMRLTVDNWRWAGVPVFIRTGKRLAKRSTEVVMVFQRPPHLPFAGKLTRGLQPNALILRIQPDEGISLRFGAKVPGQDYRVRTVAMDFSYKDAFGTDPPEAYERLLLDAMIGDPTLFIRTDEVEQAWRLLEPVQEAFAEGYPHLSLYAAGTWGPLEAARLLEPDGYEWVNP